jgi:hypothetical protein
MPETVPSNYLYNAATVGGCSRIYFTVADLQKVANTLRGGFTINGLAIAPNNTLSNTNYGQNLSLYINNSGFNVESLDSQSQYYGYPATGTAINVIPTTIPVGTRVNWGLDYSVTSQFGTNTATLGAPANSWSGWSNMGDMQTGNATASAEPDESVSAQHACLHEHHHQYSGNAARAYRAVLVDGSYDHVQPDRRGRQPDQQR